MLRIILITIIAGTAVTLADRQFDQAEVEQLLQTLTRQPRQSWLPYGTIQARHLQYHEFQNKITDSSEIITFDGQKYNWSVSLNPDQSLDMNRGISENPNDAQTPSEDLIMNKENIYIWNGKKQVRYYKATDYAVVLLGKENSSQLVSGPPSAGIIPWGSGDCSLAVLRANSPAVYEFSDAQGTKIKMEYTENKYNPPARITFVLSPEMDYAVLSYTMQNELALLRNTYQDYTRVGSFWVPRKIMIERFDQRGGQDRLMSYDDWRFENIKFEKPLESTFSVKFKPGTVVEMQPSQSVKTFMYQAPQNRDIEPLLEDKILILNSGQESNCATAAVSHIARKFAKTISKERVAQLAANKEQTTALNDMKTALEEIGLKCVAITTDIETLGKISDCIKIVHLPESNHYVIVDQVEPDYVWVIDLVNRKFYWKKRLNEFLLEWNKGTALLVSDREISLPSHTEVSFLDTPHMAKIVGGEFGKYSCNELIQDYQHVLCELPIGFLCGGAYYKYYERYGCKEDANGGTCVGEKMLGYEFTHCINDINSGCTITGEWEGRYIRACQ